MESSEKKLRQVGRPLSFDRDAALGKAMRQFWETGYETTSVADLTRVMEITPPSLYAAFGDKEKLFLEALTRYTTPGPKPTADMIREAPSAEEAARQLLEGSARFFTQRGFPAGCMVASAAATGSADAKRVRMAVRQVRVDTAAALEQRIHADVSEGVLPVNTDARALAAMIIAVIQGLSTLARDGASRSELLDVVEQALMAWPRRKKRGQEVAGSSRSDREEL
jgi:AcrR family transcriptional regulator